MRKPAPTAGKLAQELEQKRESKRIRALRRQYPELEIVECRREARMKIQEIQENAEAEVMEIAEAESIDLGIHGQGYTLQVSEGVFTRPKKEQAARKPGRRKP